MKLRWWRRRREHGPVAASNIRWANEVLAHPDATAEDRAFAETWRKLFEKYPG